MTKGIPEPPEGRFWNFVAKKDNECWVWTGGNSGAGYGKFSVARRNVQAHRFSYEMHIGEIPPGMHLDHLCRNRACVNPKHLEPVTPAENARRGKALVTHCPHGHEYSLENTWTNRIGHRFCRTCRSRRAREHEKRKWDQQ